MPLRLPPTPARLKGSGGSSGGRERTEALPLAFLKPSFVQGEPQMTEFASSRREFLGQAVTGTAVVLPWSGLVVSAASSSSRMPVAVIGCGGMGLNHIRALVERNDVAVSAVCDVDQLRCAAAAEIVQQKTGLPPATTGDLRTILAQPEIKAVWIATPDHWHTPAAILALHAGKHVYVEKPCSHNVQEGRWLVDTAAKTGRVVQVGTQSRSSAHIQKAVQRLRDGVIGDVLVAKAWNSQLRSNLGHASPEAPPSTLDFDTWLGPAPAEPYRRNLLPATWRFFTSFGCGDIGNDGVHEIDIARWGLGVTTHPQTVAALGSKFFFGDDQQFPDTQYCVFEYGSDRPTGQRRQLIFEQRDWSPYVQEGFENGNAFYGTRGMMILGKQQGYRIFGPRNKLLEEGSGSPDLAAHHANFLAAIAGQELPAASATEGHLSAALCHFANIACQLKTTLQIDPDREVITNSPQAQSQLRRIYRSDHWSVPAQA
jgi:predicted dehydrogenase